MKICKRVLSLLAALVLLALPRIHASTQTGSLSVQMAYGGQAVPGGSITCYQLAALGSDWQYKPVPAFTDCGIELNGPLSPADARYLAQYAEEKRIPGQTQDLGNTGLAAFSPLRPGLYLLVQREAAEGYLPISPFSVGIPQQVGGVLSYHVDASPKCAPEPDGPKIPQTGQLRWPVPVMTALGLFFLAAGLLLKREEPDA